MDDSETLTPETGAMTVFLTAPPGLEPLLAAEAGALAFARPRVVAGGVEIDGDWPEVWRAHLRLRGATRVLVRIAAFRAPHLAQLDKRARRAPWRALLRPKTRVRVEAACKRSRIYHAGAAAQRVETALREEAGAVIDGEAALRVLARIEEDLCTLSLDVTGAALHQRGAKQAVGKAPLRETMAALFLRACGYDGAEPVIDPMCGSGTFVLEAAEIAAGLAPGRHRGFAFEQLATFDAEAWRTMRGAETPSPPPHAPQAIGWDRDAGAVAMSRENAARAGVDAWTAFEAQPASAARPPNALSGRSGLVMVNPPYGARIGDKDGLRALYGALGRTLREHFSGWRVGLVTSEPSLARACGLPFAPPGPPIPHGGLKIRLYRAGPLP